MLGNSRDSTGLGPQSCGHSSGCSHRMHEAYPALRAPVPWGPPDWMELGQACWDLSHSSLPLVEPRSPLRVSASKPQLPPSPEGQTQQTVL